jgi:hypothetical protein
MEEGQVLNSKAKKHKTDKTWHSPEGKPQRKAVKFQTT